MLRQQEAERKAKIKADKETLALATAELKAESIEEVQAITDGFASTMNNAEDVRNLLLSTSPFLSSFITSLHSPSRRISLSLTLFHIFYLGFST